MKTAAPVLDYIVARLEEESFAEAGRARAELRALLAVAVAAQAVANRYQKAWARNANNKDDRLVRCLSRLDKVSK